MKLQVKTWFILALAAFPFCLMHNAVADQKNTKSVKMELLSPVNGQKVHGPLRIEARVNNPDQISYVEFYIQEQGAKDSHMWRDFRPPYFWGGDGQTVDTTLFEDGPASVVAFCFGDASSPPVAQERVNIVIDNRKPIVKITAPKEGATVKGTVTVQVEASDPGGVVKRAGIVVASVYLDGWLVQRMTSPPFRTVVNTCLSRPGLHSIRAVAEDSEGLTSSDTVVVTVAQDGTALSAGADKRR